MSPTNFPGLIQANNDRWSKMVIDFDAIAAMNLVAAQLIASKARYQALFAQTDVPWPVIAVIHERECSRNFNLSIAQGDPWNAVSVHVPAGRGPFASWDDAAVDALTVCEHMNQWGHWDTMGGVLTRLEMYNGLGYANRQVPLTSPYIWSRTDQYVSGKYVADHVFDPNFVDVQEGCAPLLGCMMLQDQSIQSDFGWDAAPAKPSLTADDGVLHDTRWLQTALNQLGAAPQLHVDGGWGQHTITALKAYQAGAGLAANGRYNVPTLDSLETAVAGIVPPPVPPTTQA
jgi:lysozyme family protein